MNSPFKNFREQQDSFEAIITLIQGLELQDNTIRSLEEKVMKLKESHEKLEAELLRRKC